MGNGDVEGDESAGFGSGNDGLLSELDVRDVKGGGLPVASGSGKGGLFSNIVFFFFKFLRLTVSMKACPRSTEGSPGFRLGTAGVPFITIGCSLLSSIA